MKFSQMVLRPGLSALVIAGISTAILGVAATVIVGEARLEDAVALNQWLARDIASQFSGVASRSLARAQKFGELVRPDSGGFDSSSKREFDLDPSVKAVWVLDASATGPLQPLARLDREGFQVSEVQTENIRGLIDTAIQNGSAAGRIEPGLTVVAVKIGDLPRTVAVFTDESIFSRANGGPWGDKWMLFAPTADKAESVLMEATSELREGTVFPSHDEISRLVTTQNPANERTEFTSELIAASGAAFRVSGVQTGAFGVMAVVVTPLESLFVSTNLLFKIAIGIVIAISLLTMLVQTIRFHRATSRRGETGP